MDEELKTPTHGAKRNTDYVPRAMAWVDFVVTDHHVHKKHQRPNKLCEEPAATVCFKYAGQRQVQIHLSQEYKLQ